MERRRCSILLAAMVLAGGCEGVIDPGPGVRDPSMRPIGPRGDGSFACTPGEAPSVTPLRRLSRVQYENTLADLFASVRGLDVDTLAGPALTRIPADEAATYSGNDDRLSGRHVDGFYDVADAVAGGAVSGATLAALAGDCAMTPTASAGCIDAFLDDFGLRAFRRPLTMEERARYHALNDGSRDGREVYRAIVFSILMAPQFLYHVQVDGPSIAGDTHFSLGPYELASRISYHFWQTMPDAQLFAAAADGSLVTEAGYEAEVRRVFEDARTEETATTFYSEWLQIGQVTLRPGAALDALIDDAGLGGSESAFLTAAAEEVQTLANHYTFDAPGTFDDLLRSNLTFTTSPELAGLYGITPSDGTSAVQVPTDERAGLLTRAAFLVSGNHTTHPIHRGFRVRNRLLCEELHAPAPSELPPGSLVPPPQDPTVSTRVRFERKVAAPQCAGCHARMNPIGYVFEQYDGLGRFRTHETVYDEATGEVLAMLPVDSTAAPRIEATDTTEVSTAAELTDLVAESPRVNACFAMNYFRFTHRRTESAADGCALEGVRTALVEGRLSEALLAIALDPSFRQRTVE